MAMLLRLLLALVLALPLTLSAQDPVVAVTETPAAAAVASIYASPGDTLTAFLQSFPDPSRERVDRTDPIAIEAISFSGSLALLGVRERQEMARQLRDVIVALRGEFTTAEWNKLATSGSDFTVLETPAGAVRLRKQDNGDWKFTPGSIESIPALVRELAADGKATRSGATAYTGLRDLFPKSLQGRSLYLEDWQWFALLFAIIIGVIVSRLASELLRTSSAKAIRHLEGATDLPELDHTLRPVGIILMAVVWYLSIPFLQLPPSIVGVLTLATRVVGALGMIWAASSFVDLCIRIFSLRAARTNSRQDDLLVLFIGRIVKVFIVAIVLILLMNNMGVNVASLLAGLGLGGLAFALAAKNTVENIFGSVTVLMDQPFHVGDYVIIGGNIEGTVEAVGFRSTRIRTAYDSIITVPNSILISSQVDNWGSRRYRRWTTKLGVQYDTPADKLDAFCEGVRELIRLHPATRKDAYHVYANEFGDSALSVLLITFFIAPDYGTECRERHRLFLDIVRLADRLGVQFAFPTQTVHLVQGEATSYSDVPAPGRDATVAGLNAARSIVRSIRGESIAADPPVAFPEVPKQVPADEPVKRG
jgi:MscS family membrane protein